jgi:indole-3-glycerol phosphate synthase
MDRARALAASREEIQRLREQRVSEVTPSRRDFAQYVATQRAELAVIARVSRGVSVQTTAQLIDLARACDDADVAALAISTGMGGVTIDEMGEIAAATTAPILRADPTLDPSQLYHARLHGADAALFPAADLDAVTLHTLVSVAGSLHMASVIEVMSTADIARAVQMPHAIIGLCCTAPNRSLDLEHTQRLARQLPPRITVIVLPAVRSATECAALCGVCDAVVAGDVLLTASDVSATLQELLNR